MKGLGISQSSHSVGACGRSKLEEGAGKADPGHRGGSDGHISFTLPVKESPSIDMFPFFLSFTSHLQVLLLLSQKHCGMYMTCPYLCCTQGRCCMVVFQRSLIYNDNGGKCSLLLSCFPCPLYFKDSSASILCVIPLAHTIHIFWVNRIDS